MKTQEIRELNVDEISEKIEKAKQELFNLRIQAKTGKLEKQARISLLRRDVARMLTIQKELSSK